MDAVRKSPRILRFITGTALVAGLLIAGSPGMAEPANVKDTRPTAVVSLGDNGISGEGAGNYEPGTNGENGNWCRRSKDALVHKTNLAANTFNLACSGSNAAHVSLADTVHYTEGSQAKRLIPIAKEFRVTTVIVRVGSNDDPAFSATVVECMRAYLYPAKTDCSTTLRPAWPHRLGAMKIKVRTAMNDVKTAMSSVGYAAGSYNLVLTSYASPITERMDPAWSKGCPFRINDARWARTEAVPQLNQALRDVARMVSARFLDLGQATENHEACSGGSNPATEWQTRITVDPWEMVHGELDPEERRRAAESFHPNAIAHLKIGGCMTEFVLSTSPDSTCIEGTDGNLHPIKTIGT
jgi:hypothetical protein